MPGLVDITRRSLDPSSVGITGPLTQPRTWGVYQLPAGTQGRRYHYGNHPVRQWELEREYGCCTLRFLFGSRGDARQVATTLSRVFH